MYLGLGVPKKFEFGQRGLFFLCVEPSAKFALEIFEGAQLVKINNQLKKYRVVGVATSRQDAFLLTRNIIADFYKTETKIENLKNFTQDIH